MREGGKERERESRREGRERERGREIVNKELLLPDI